jgi:hypothetical protein
LGFWAAGSSSESPHLTAAAKLHYVFASGEAEKVRYLSGLGTLQSVMLILAKVS